MSENNKLCTRWCLQRYWKIVCILFLLSSNIGVGVAAETPAYNFHEEGRATSSVSAVSGLKQIQQGYSFRIWMNNCLVLGKSAFENREVPPDETSSCSAGIGCEYPLGLCVEHLFGMGPWIGGIINGARYVTETYNGDAQDSELMPQSNDSSSTSFWTTSIADSQYDPNRKGYYKYAMNRLGIDDDGDGKIDEDELDGLDNDHDWMRSADDIGADGIPDTLETGCKGTYDPIMNPDPAYDNFESSRYDTCHPNPDTSLPRMNNRERYTEKNGIPDHGEPHVDEDYGAVSDQDIYVGATDTVRGSSVPLRHHKMGIKIFQKSYAWQEKFAEAILPIDYSFVNIGKNTITDVYVAFYANMDVGPLSIPNYKEHNYSAYIPSIHTAYVDNPVDRGSPPLGLTLLHTSPDSLSGMKIVWQWFNNGNRTGPGTNDSTLYDWMSGEKGLIYPDQRSTELSDTKFLLCFGPFKEMKPGDTVHANIALVSGNCVNNCPGSLIDNAYKITRKPPRPPVGPLNNMPAPKLKVSEGRNKVTLDWGSHLGGVNPVEVWDDSNKVAERYPADNWRRINPPKGHTRGGRIFEGFRLYRSEDPSGSPNSFTMIRQFDVKDDEYGFNVGLDTTFIDSNLHTDKVYWYSVTAFSIPNFYFRLRTAVVDTSDSISTPKRFNMLANDQIDTIFMDGMESSILQNAWRITLPFSTSASLNEVKVVPNPYRGDQHYTTENDGWEGYQKNWNEYNRQIKFIHLPKDCTIRIFSLDGSLVKTLDNLNSKTPGEVSWNLISEGYWEVASGIYVFSVESSVGRQIGKFVIIR